MKTRTVLILLIALATFGIYAKSLHNDFVLWDDNKFIYENPQVTEPGWGSLREIWNPQGQLIYQPLVTTSYKWQYQIVKLDSFYYHLFDLIFHGFNSVLVFWFVSLLSGNPWLGFLCGLWFGIHPLHVESVAWATERRDVLSAFFFLLALLAWEFWKTVGRRRDYATAFFCFLLGLFCKPMIVMLPLIFFLLDYSRNRRFLFFEKVPFLFLSTIFGGVVMAAQQEGYQQQAVSWFFRILTALRTLVFYLEKTIFPVRLSAIYPSNIYFTPWELALSALILAAAIAVLLRWRKKYPEFLFGFLFFILTVAPTLLITSSQKLIFAADRYMYIPSIGLFYVLAFFVYHLWDHARTKSFRNFGLTAAVAALTLFFSYTAYARTLVWKNIETLFRDVLKKYPQAVEAHTNLGLVYSREGQTDKAIEEYQKALELYPAEAIALNNLGNILLRKEMPDEAEVLFEHAIRARPDLDKPHYNLAKIYRKRGKFQEAISELQTALRLDPKSQDAQNLLGVIYFEQGAFYSRPEKWEESLAPFQKALEIHPDDPVTWYNLGVSYSMMEKYHNAVENFQRAIQLKPDFAEAWNNLGIAKVRLGQYTEGVAAFQKAIEINPQYEAAQNNLKEMQKAAAQSAKK